MSKHGKKGQRTEDPDVDKNREAARAEQNQLMRERGEGEADTSKPVSVFEPDAREFANALEADGFAPYQFLPRHAFEKMARKQGKPVSKEQVISYYGVDDTMPEGATCWLCDKNVVARKWAVSTKGGFVADRDSTDGAPLFVAAVTKRYNKGDRPFAAVACGSPFDPDSHLTLTREVKRTEADGTPVYFRDERGEVKPRRLGLYGRVKADVDAELSRQSGTQEAISRLGGLVNRQRPAGGRPGGFRPSTPRGQRRDGGPTPHNQGR